MTTLKKDLDNIITTLSQILNLNNENIEKLKLTFTNFNDDDKYKLIGSLSDDLQTLQEADLKLKELTQSSLFAPYKDKIKDKVELMNKELIELQVLSLIQNKPNCDKVIKELAGILTEKIQKVNIILKNNLASAAAADVPTPDTAGLSGGSRKDIYINKYIKYKKKYISLKNIM
jgi:hypothetical protein